MTGAVNHHRSWFFKASFLLGAVVTGALGASSLLGELSFNVGNLGEMFGAQQQRLEDLYWLQPASCHDQTGSQVLARISHHLATANRDLPQSAAFPPIGLLNILHSMPPLPSSRKNHISRHLSVLATRRGEICGLALLRGLSPGGLRAQASATSRRRARRRDTAGALRRPQHLMVPPMAFDDTGLILIWSKPESYEHVAGYNVYQDGSLLGTTSKLFYSVSGLTAATTYSFTVASVHTSGAEVGTSNVCSATTAATAEVFYPEDYGAAADGVTLDTVAIQAAIDACAPGGRVHLRAGKTFLSGAVFLKSNMTFQVDGEILGSSNPAHYPLTSLRFPYYPSGNNFMGLINAYHDHLSPTSAGRPYGAITDLRVCGSGVINGCQGYHAADPHQVLGHGDTPLGLAEIGLAGNDDKRRGDMVTIKGVDDVFVGGWNGTLTLVYPSEHTIFISYSNRVTVAGVHCDTYDIHNADGVNLCTTDTAYIFNSHFDTGDDCINMNAGQGQQGVNENIPVQHIRVFNCTTDRGHGGYVVGSFTAAWVQDSLIEDCTLKNYDVSNGIAIRMKTGSTNGGGARRITCRDITIAGCSRQGIFLDTHYDAGAGFSSGGPGQFSGNTFKNISIDSAMSSIYVYGLDSPFTPHTQNHFESITGTNNAHLRYCTDSSFVEVNVSSWTVGAGCSGNTSSGSPGCPF